MLVSPRSVRYEAEYFGDQIEEEDFQVELECDTAEKTMEFETDELAQQMDQSDFLVESSVMVTEASHIVKSILLHLLDSVLPVSAPLELAAEVNNNQVHILEVDPGIEPVDVDMNAVDIQIGSNSKWFSFSDETIAAMLSNPVDGSDQVVKENQVTAASTSVLTPTITMSDNPGYFTEDYLMSNASLNDNEADE